jgi:hypothetical protein
VSNSWIQTPIFGIIAGTIYATASYLYRKRGLEWSRKQAAEVRATSEKALAEAERALALSKETEASHERALELQRRLERLTARATRIAYFNVLLLGTSGYLSCSHTLEIDLTRREPDVEECRSRYAALEEDRRIVRDRYETARSSAVAGPDADSEVAAVDAMDSAVSTLHDLMVGWYRRLEDAGWPGGQSSPEDPWPARQALSSACVALSHIADEFEPSTTE